MAQTIHIPEGARVMVSCDDETPTFLEDAIIAGSGITIVVLDPGGDEQLEVSTELNRSVQVGDDIDFQGDEIKFRTLTANTTFTFSNPQLGVMILLELTGVFTVTLPATVVEINGDYLPAIGKNYMFAFCNDAVTPEYLVSWGVTI